MIESERIKILQSNDNIHGSFVVYWMQQSQRVHYNHALQVAIEKANEMHLPLIVYFGLTDQFPDANLRHYIFMLEGLIEVKHSLYDNNILFILRKEDPSNGIIRLSDEASLVITDRGYTRIQRQWRKKVKSKIDCSLIQVESDVVIPVEKTSVKEEYGAYTIRPKINRLLSQFLNPCNQPKLIISSLNFDFKSLDIINIHDIIKNLKVDKSVFPSIYHKGGSLNAIKNMNFFLQNHLKLFDEQRNDPSKQVSSNLSPYLHFGQISSLFIALEVLKHQKKYWKSFLEELIIRRELSMNFVYYNKHYDSMLCLPNWAFNTLKNHADDKREYIYNLEEFEHAKTHDSYWNAAQKELVVTGKMHGYMRMYWGKKIIEWTNSPEKAYEIALFLNNKYELDGRDPNAYAGIAWCFGKHDRAWKERPIFGKIRYMNDKGLKRKGNIGKYIERVNKLEEKIL